MAYENEIIEHLKEIKKLSAKDKYIDDFYLGILITYILFLPFISPELKESEEV